MKRYKLLKLNCQKTERTVTGATMCARHTGKPVENEDAGKLNGGRENMNRVEREGLSNH